MTTTTWIAGFVAMAVLLIFGRRLFARNSTGQFPRVAAVNGVVSLRPPRWYHLYLAALALLPGVVVTILLVSAEMLHRNGIAGRIIAVLAVIGSVAWSAFLIMEELKLCIRIDGVALERVGVLGIRRMTWSEVERIGYNPNGRWFFVSAKGGRRLWVGEDMDGISDFAELALANAPRKVFEAAPEVRRELELWVEAAPARL